MISVRRLLDRKPGNLVNGDTRIPERRWNNAGPLPLSLRLEPFDKSVRVLLETLAGFPLPVAASEDRRVLLPRQGRKVGSHQ